MRVFIFLLTGLIFTTFAHAQNAEHAVLQFRMALPKGDVVHASFSPDGEKVLIVGKESAQIWSAITGKLMFDFPEKIPGSGEYYIEWQPNGSKFIVYGFSDKGLIIFDKKLPALLYDAEAGKQIAVLQGKKKDIDDVKWSKDGSRILTVNTKVSRLGEIETSVWSEKGEYITSLYNNRLLRVEFIDGGKKILFDQGYFRKEKPIVIWDVEGARVLRSFDQTYEKSEDGNLARLIEISPDEQLLCGYYGISEGVLCWEADGDESVKFAFKDSNETGDHSFCGFSPDGQRFAVFKSKPRRLEFVNSRTGKTESVIEDRENEGCALAETELRYSSWSADGRFFITHDGNDKILFWEIATAKQTGIFQLVGRYRFASSYFDYEELSLHPTLPLLASVNNRMIRLWDLQTGKMIKKIEANEIGNRLGQRRFSDWNRNGKQLMTSSKNDNEILIWEIKIQ